ncbi:universal stress protein [Arcobacter sp.]|uniref:universal stress protein n=1 Tax=Arcobacter sp. TaxID=1872629 RepID=UPI003D0D16CB
MSSKKVLICIDDSSFCKAACDYGVYISKLLNLPLLLLNVIDHQHISKKVDLSGSIGLGSRENLLEELTVEEQQESKELIKNGKNLLKTFTEYVKNQGIQNHFSLQRHGNFEENLEDLEKETHLAIIGFDKTSSNHKNIEDIIRALNIPILLVNAEFTSIKSILMAYDGSDFANKAINIATKEPIFPNMARHIVNVNKDKDSSQKLLKEAKNLFAKANFEVQTASLEGDKIDEILKYQEENSIDIVAMGAYSHNRLKSVIFGSFTSKMLEKSKKPLLLFR